MVQDYYTENMSLLVHHCQVKLHLPQSPALPFKSFSLHVS